MLNNAAVIHLASTFVRSSSISESLFVDRLSSEAKEVRRRTELPRIIVRRTRQLSAQKGSLCPHCALLEKSTTGTISRMLLSLLRQRVARDLLQMRNLSPIWTVGRPRTDGQISLSVALRWPYCRPRFNGVAIVQVHTKNGCFGFRECIECHFRALLELSIVFLLHSRFSSWPHGLLLLSPRHCLLSLLCSSLDRGRKKRNRSKTNRERRPCRWIITLHDRFDRSWHLTDRFIWLFETILKKPVGGL